jgi:hypothetical protein
MSKIDFLKKLLEKSGYWKNLNLLSSWFITMISLKQKNNIKILFFSHKKYFWRFFCYIFCNICNILRLISNILWCHVCNNLTEIHLKICIKYRRFCNIFVTKTPKMSKKMKKYVKNYGHIVFEKKTYLLPLSSQSDF